MEVLEGKHRFAGHNIKFSVWHPGQPVMICKDPLCGIDSETTLIQNRHQWPDLVIAGFCSTGIEGDECQLVMWNDIEEYLSQFLELNPTTKLVFFNLPFDTNVMGRELFIKELDKDGRMMELQMNYSIFLVGKQGWLPGRITLYDVTKRALGVQLNKEDGTRVSFNRDTPVTLKQCEYLVEDCAATWLCGKTYNNMPTESHQARASFVLAELGFNGMLVDKEALAKTRGEVASKMPELAENLKSYGFRLKKDTDSMTAVERLLRVASLLNIEKADFALRNIKIISASWWWIIANTLYTTIAIGGVTISDVADQLREVIRLMATFDKEDKKAQKVLRELGEKAKLSFIEPLAEFECDVCIVGLGGKKPTSAKPAMAIVEILVEDFVAGKLVDSMKAFNEDFKEEHEYYLGWLSTTEKPLSPAKFIQKHLRKMMADHPGLVFPLTDTSKKNIGKYQRECNRKNIVPDAVELDRLATYQCKGQDMWLLDDIEVTDPFMNTYIDYKHREKLISTYLTDKYIEEDGRVHPRFRGFLSTGRTGCSSPNLWVSFKFLNFY